MAEVLYSPGISLTETDLSYIPGRPLTAGAAILGPTVKGPVMVPTKVTSYGDYVRRFGTIFEIENADKETISTQEFMTSLAAKSYFEQGGDSLLVVRIANRKAFAPAENTAIKNSLNFSMTGSEAKDNEPFTINTIGWGELYNNTDKVDGEYVEVYDGAELDASGPTRSATIGALKNGTAENFRWEINNIDETTGTFSLVIRRGDDVSKNKVVLETFNNLSLDPESPNYIEKVVGDQKLQMMVYVDDDGKEEVYIDVDGNYPNKSRYVYVKVNTPTLHYLKADGVTINTDPAGKSFSNYLPQAQSGAFFGGTGKVGIAYDTEGKVVDDETSKVKVTRPEFDMFRKTVDVYPHIEDNETKYYMSPQSDGDQPESAFVIDDSEFPAGTTASIENMVKDNFEAKYSIPSNYTTASNLGPQNPAPSSMNTDTIYWVDTATVSRGLYIKASDTGSAESVEVKKIQGNVNEDGIICPLIVGLTAAEFKEGQSIAYFGDITEATKYPQTVTPYDYTDAITLLHNEDEYQINIVSAPGLLGGGNSGRYSWRTQVDAILSLAEERGDCIAVVDVNHKGEDPRNAAEHAVEFNSSYGATYWPWLQMYASTGRLEWVPASVVIPGIYVFTDKIAAPWFAPAGLLRGGVDGAVQTEKKLTKGMRDTLYKKNVNPIATFPGSGIVVYGQKTLQKKASALDRVNVRRLLIELKDKIKKMAGTILFEQNTAQLRASFKGQLDSYLDTVQKRAGLYAYQVVISESAEEIDRNELHAAIYLQPTKVIEFIYINFVITPTGVDFGDYSITKG